MSHSGLYLNELLNGLLYSRVSGNPLINHITIDSREVQPGGLFVALRGQTFDARLFIPEVLERGVAAVLVDDSDPSELDPKLRDIPNVIRVKNLVMALSKIAGRFYHHPSRKLTVIGITGTNGKTTIAWLMAQLLQKLGRVSGVVGTLGAGPYGELISTGLTTPDAFEVQKCLAEMHRAGVDVVCMEVSSHALELGRVEEIYFDILVYSNLSQDHLDFHLSMDHYAAAKKRLFEDFQFSHAVVNCDDSLGADIVDSLGGRVMSYGQDSGDLRASGIKLSPRGLDFSISIGGERSLLNTPLIGKFNTYNLLAVIGVAIQLGYSLDEISPALEACQPVPGRMQRVEFGDQEQPVVVVDYAHTPDALEKALLACRTHCTGELAIVFGCGGDRDRKKRPQMGSLAERIADVLILTDDNPRSEKPVKIVADIQTGMKRPGWVLHDRGEAIFAAITGAHSDDWVLIAGKGHETSQTYVEQVLEFDDCAVAEQALMRLVA